VHTGTSDKFGQGVGVTVNGFDPAAFPRQESAVPARAAGEVEDVAVARNQWRPAPDPSRGFVRPMEVACFIHPVTVIR
jgi:hypothetical protein